MTRRASGGRMCPPGEVRGYEKHRGEELPEPLPEQNWTYQPGTGGFLGENQDRHLRDVHPIQCDWTGAPGNLREFHGRLSLDPQHLPERHVRARKLVERARMWIESHADDENLSVNALASAFNMSRTSLHRKLVSSAGQPPGEFIRTVRLELARRLLREGSANVSEIAYAVGFVSLSGFSRAYRVLFGEPPSSSRRRADSLARHDRSDWNKSTNS